MNEALTLHGRLASMEIKPLHNRLMECFVTMRKNLRDSVSWDHLLELSFIQLLDSDEAAVV